MGVAGAIAAFVAWTGASAIVLADGRRGVALGLALLAAAIAFLAWSSAGPVAGVALATGGAVAAFMRDRSGPAGWVIMPAGSTPRLILCIAAALLSLWLAASVMSGPGVPLRFMSLSVIGLMGGRVLASREPAVLAGAVAAMALALVEAASVAGSSPGLPLYIAGAVLAAGVMFVRVPAAPNAT